MRPLVGLAVAMVLVAAARPVHAQSVLPLHVDIAASTPAFSGAASRELRVRSADVNSGCSSEPVTHDSAVWWITLYPSWVGEGDAITLVPSLLPYVRSSMPLHVYVPVIQDVSIGDINLRVRDKEYRAATTIRRGQLVLTFGPMTLAEAADFAEALPQFTALSQEIENAAVRATVYDVVATMDEAAKAGVDVQRWGRDAGTLLYESKILRPFGDDVSRLATEGTGSTAFEARLAAPSVAELNSVRRAIQTLGDINQSNDAFFIVDEPCLQLALSPLVAGDDTTMAVSFRARYDFYSSAGKGFLKLRADGSGSQGGTYYDRIEGTADFGFNRAAGEQSVLSLGGSGSYAVKREAGARIDAWRTTAKLRVQGPSFAGVFGPLPGAGTSPLASLEVGLTGGTGPGAGATDWIGRFDIGLTGRFTTRMSIDLKTNGAWAAKPLFGTADRFVYGSVQMRFNVNRDWDYLIRYECGRKEPDYHSFCGTQSGLALTAGR